MTIETPSALNASSQTLGERMARIEGQQEILIEMVSRLYAKIDKLLYVIIGALITMFVMLAIAIVAGLFN